MEPILIPGSAVSRMKWIELSACDSYEFACVSRFFACVFSFCVRLIIFACEMSTTKFHSGYQIEKQLVDLSSFLRPHIY